MKNLYAQITDLQKNQNAPKCKKCGAVVLTDTAGNVLNEET